MPSCAIQLVQLLRFLGVEHDRAGRDDEGAWSMRQRSRVTGVRALALVGLLAAQPVHAAGSDAPVTLEQVMAELRTVHHVDARYIEHRTLHILSKPIETRGSLRFEAPAHLEKVTDATADGSMERLTIDRDRLTIERGGGRPPIALALHEHPEIGVLVDSIRATLSGDGNALQRSFEVTPSGTIDHWQLVLQPREVAQRAVLQWMRLSGYGERITAIDTASGDGDRTEMSIVEQTR